MKTLLCSILLFSLSIPLVNLYSKNPDLKKQEKVNSAVIQEWKFFDVNSIQCTINSSGPYADYLRTNSSGLFWPKGTAKTAVYTAGIWVIGKHRPSGQLRTAVQDYSTEYQPGPILSTYNTTTNSVTALGDPADPCYRIYKVSRKDSVGGNPDYDNWPVDLGAPYTDLNGDGVYTQGIDKPFLWGDQVLWCVYNDGNSGKHAATGKTNPMGIEIQTTYFGFDNPDALGNTMFMRWKLINKSDAEYDSVFISMWSDTDLGYANDDLAAVDTLRKLAYVYNGDNDDEGASGYGTKTPACGFVFLQGPKKEAALTDSALFEGKKIGGFSNLPGTSHVVYFDGGGGIGWNDPPLGDIAFAERAYNYQNGLIGATAAPFINPQTNQPTKFVFPGDPVTGIGWNHANSVTAKDVRSMISSGPFTLAKGDTQEIVGGFVIAQGTDRLNSIVQLRSYVDSAQRTFNSNFIVTPKQINPFRVSVAPLPNKIILEWGDPNIYSHTENYSYTGTNRDFKFEGYNIYQYSENSVTAIPKLISSIDLKNNITQVSDWVFDPVSGTMVYKPVVNGTDSGIKRYFHIDHDAFTGDSLINGKEYYFAVTSYYYNYDIFGSASGIPKIIESPRIPFVVIPDIIKPGNSIIALPGQFLPTDRSFLGIDAVSATVVNPFAVIGGTYEVSFNGVDTSITSWNLRNTSINPNTFLLNNYSEFSADNASPIVNGVQFRVTKPLAGARRDYQEPKGYSYLPNLSDIWFTGKSSIEVFGSMDAFNNGIAYPRISNFVNKQSKVKPQDLKKIEIRFNTTLTQKAYRYLDANAPSFGILPLRDASFAPYIKHRGSGGSFIYQDFVNVPFTVWEVDSIDGSYEPRQLNVGFLEKNDSIFSPQGNYVGRGAINGKWDPTHSASGASEVLFIFSSSYDPDTLPAYTRNPYAPLDNSQFLNMRSQLDSVDVYYAIWIKRKDSLATFKEGDKFVITPNYILNADQVFKITVPVNTSVRDYNNSLPTEFALQQNYPNPFNPTTTINYQLPKNGFVTIKIYNILGQLVKTLLSEDQSAGYFSVQWQGTDEHGIRAASGLYLYVLQTDNFTSVKKMILLK